MLPSLLFYALTVAAVLLGIWVLFRASNRASGPLKADPLRRAARAALGVMLAAAGLLLFLLMAGGFDPLSWSFRDVVLLAVVFLLPLFLAALLGLYIRFRNERR